MDSCSIFFRIVTKTFSHVTTLVLCGQGREVVVISCETIVENANLSAENSEAIYAVDFKSNSSLTSW